MANYFWPSREEAAVIGTEHDRIDGIAKSTGAAKYSYDINPPKMLFARLLGSARAHANIKSIDCSLALQVPGVVLARPMPDVQAGMEVRWHGQELAVVAAETEGAATEGLAAIKIEYEDLPVFVSEEDLEAAQAAGRTRPAGNEMSREHQIMVNEEEEEEEEDFEDEQVDALFAECDGVLTERYGIQVITHMCLEPHGSTCEWDGQHLTAHLSTQNVSGTPNQFAAPLGITDQNVTVHCDYIGGGFGSKFGADSWGVEAAKISKETGRPVKLMLDREMELRTAGVRPSGFVDVKVGFDKKGKVKIWDSHQWGTSGFGGGGVRTSVVPYVFSPNLRRKATAVSTDTSPDRAWRAPHHPQGCAISQTAYDDVARYLGLDSFDVFMENLPSASNANANDRKDLVYADQMRVAADLIGWRDKWHPHGKGRAEGSIVTGLGMALHTWGGGGHGSTARTTIHPDGSVEITLGSQDLGTGTRTVIAMIAAETFGLPVEAIRVNIGSSKYPPSGPSGGSTTVGGVSESTRRSTLDALEQLLVKVAAKLEVKPEELAVRDGNIYASADPTKTMSWREACRTLGMRPLEVEAQFQPGRGRSPLSSSQVAGVQMAEVAVDRDTGVVKMKKFVAVQDMGLIISPKTAKSQIYGAVIMGIAYSLFEERICDPVRGWFLNAELSDYKLPRLGDIGEIVVHLFEPESERSRGVIGLGEPPVIAPGAAISNAVCNALGVRVPVLPMTPKRVLDAIEKASAAT